MLLAARLRRTENMFNISMSAWRTQEVQATKTKGHGRNQKTEPVYKTFKEFYDYEDALCLARGEESTSKNQPVNAFDEATDQALLLANMPDA